MLFSVCKDTWKYAQTVTRLKELTKNKKLNLKNSSYNTILEITIKSDSIGLITKEYLEKEELKKYNLVELGKWMLDISKYIITAY